jgi:hypothetical protein
MRPISERLAPERASTHVDESARPANLKAEFVPQWVHCNTRPCMILLDLMTPMMDRYQFLAVRRVDPMLRSIAEDTRHPLAGPVNVKGTSRRTRARCWRTP